MKLTAHGSRMEQILKDTADWPSKPPKGPVDGQVHTEDGRWWRRTEGRWRSFEPDHDEQLGHLVTVRAQEIEDMESLSASLVKSLGWAVRKAAESAYQETDLASDRMPYTVTVAPDLAANGYRITVKAPRPDMKTELIHGFIADEALAERSTTVQQFGAWAREVGRLLFEYSRPRRPSAFRQPSEWTQEIAKTRQQAEDLAEQGIRVNLHEWIEDLDGQAMRAIESILADS